MDFNLSEEQSMLVAGVARFVREHYTLEQRRKIALSDEGFSRAHWRTMAELGWLSLTIDPDAGGLGLSMVEVALVAEQLGRGLALEPFTAHAAMALDLLAACEIDRKPELLAAIMAGRVLVSLAHDEAGLSADATRHTRTVRQAGGGYRLDGIKQMVIGAHAADWLIVTAADEGALSLFLVASQHPGLKLESYSLLDGTRAADVYLQGVELDAAARIAGPEHGRSRLERAIDRWIVANLADALGSQAACLEICAEHLKTRQQFGQTLSKFQALQHAMAEMLVDHQGSRSMLYRALAYLDADPQQRRHAVSAAKIAVTAAGCRIAGTSIQLHGALGFTEEAAVTHHYRHQLVTEKLNGDVSEHAQRLAAGC